MRDWTNKIYFDYESQVEGCVISDTIDLVQHAESYANELISLRNDLNEIKEIKKIQVMQ